MKFADNIRRVRKIVPRTHTHTAHATPTRVPMHQKQHPHNADVSRAAALIARRGARARTPAIFEVLIPDLVRRNDRRAMTRVTQQTRIQKPNHTHPRTPAPREAPVCSGVQNASGRARARKTGNHSGTW
ncbi:hypothetical protein A0H81_06156 [Grifola frondosa]|uniref:Uncharacterized protein n=1 Tax=Grifola frondosa TaxID=5627 RepID=A0A1C7MA64_GRIFR|nr:hypothetical protein A0H81_06156 [Grifola frondosa]